MFVDRGVDGIEPGHRETDVRRRGACGCTGTPSRQIRPAWRARRHRANLAVFAFNSYKSPGVPPQPSIDRAWTAALVLILIVMILNVAARLVYRRFGAVTR